LLLNVRYTKFKLVIANHRQLTYDDWTVILLNNNLKENFQTLRETRMLLTMREDSVIGCNTVAFERYILLP